MTRKLRINQRTFPFCITIHMTSPSSSCNLPNIASSYGQTLLMPIPQPPYRRNTIIHPSSEKSEWTDYNKGRSCVELNLGRGSEFKFLQMDSTSTAAVVPPYRGWLVATPVIHREVHSSECDTVWLQRRLLFVRWIPKNTYYYQQRLEHTHFVLVWWWRLEKSHNQCRWHSTKRDGWME